MLQDLGKVIILVGIVTIVLGMLLTLFGKIPFLGKLPGDILIQKPNFTFYAPLATGILISIILTILLNIFTRK